MSAKSKEKKTTPPVEAEAKASEGSMSEESGAKQDEGVVMQPTAPLRAKKVDPHQMVTVINGVHNKLIYKSKRTGEKFVWDGFGDEQEIELSELKSAKSSSKRFFTDNWFMFDDPAIVEYLGVAQYYKFALGVHDFDSVFENKPDDIGSAVSKLSDGQKKSVAHRARLLIANGELDSMKLIAALEDALNTELIEH